MVRFKLPIIIVLDNLLQESRETGVVHVLIGIAQLLIPRCNDRGLFM